MARIEIRQLPRINIKSLIDKIHIPRKIDISNFVYAILSFALSSAKILSGITPFGTAFFAAACTSKNLMPSLVAVAAGSLIAHPSAVCLCYVITAAVIACVNVLWSKGIKTSVKAYIAGGVLFLTKTAAVSSGGILAYDMLVNLCEAFISAITVFIADKAMPVIFPAKKRTFLSYEETVSTIFVSAIVLLALNNIPAIWGLKLGNIFGITVILLLNGCSSGPAGALAGIIIGAVNSVGTYNAGAVIGAYAFSALVSSLLSHFGKMGVSLGFILANAVITIFLNGSTEVLINIYEILISSVMFFLLADKLSPKIENILRISGERPGKKGDKLYFAYKDRLKRTANSLNVLSKNFSSQAFPQASAENISVLISKTAEKSCSDCSLRYCCWQKKGAETKKAFFSMLHGAEKNGKAYLKDISDDIKNRCIRTEKLVSSFNDSYELYRTVQLWQRRVDECKSLSCAQLGNIAKILNEMSEEKHLQADAQTCTSIRSALDSRGFVPEGINSYIKSGGNLVTEIKFDRKKYRDDMKYLIAPCISEAVGVKMRFNEIYKDDKSVYLSYSLCERYCRATGAASIKKDGEKVCGDSFTSLNLSNGTYIAAISDGMGSGEMASIESQKTIELLKNFMQCGFDTMDAAKLINSSLLLTGREEMFSTIDMCSVNMHTGLADFIKIGGASTYIKKGGAVEKLSYSSLPAGIVDEINPKHFSRKIESDTVIIMVSDGVENASADDSWLEKRLRSVDTVNPHVIADKILDLALFYGGGKAKDDMTVIATRIWEENNV